MQSLSDMLWDLGTNSEISVNDTNLGGAPDISPNYIGDLEICCACGSLNGALGCGRPPFK